MNKEQILELLKTIKYPGFNRDIVSFGMVHDVLIDGQSLTLTLNISSQNDKKKQQVVNDVKKHLKNNFSSVKINLKETDTPNQTPQHPVNTSLILDKVKHIIAISSGKGGVGKSTIAANIACAMSREGLKIGLLDLDIYGPSMPIIMNINEQPEMSKENKLIPLEKYGIKIMSFGFISGNDTPVIWRGPLVSRMTEQFFRDVEWGELDVLVLDLPPGTGDIQLTLTQKLRMTGAIIVTTPQDIALTDVRKGADMFKKVNTPVLGVIENMSGLGLSGSVKPSGVELIINGDKMIIDNNGEFKFNIDLFKTGGGEKESARLGVPLIGKIPISQRIISSTDNGKPLTSENKIISEAKVYINITKKILSLIYK